MNRRELLMKSALAAAAVAAYSISAKARRKKVIRIMFRV